MLLDVIGDTTAIMRDVLWDRSELRGMSAKSRAFNFSFSPDPRTAGHHSSYCLSRQLEKRMRNVRWPLKIVTIVVTPDLV